MGYEYSRPLKKDEVLVGLIDKNNFYPELEGSIKEAANQYGFQFLTISEGIPDSPYLLQHLIIIDGFDDPVTITNKYAPLIKKCTSATIAISYTNNSAFINAEEDINQLKNHYAGKINYLLPNKCGSQYKPSLQKLVDNSICDSVRIKYKPIKIGELNSSQIPSEIIKFFQDFSQLFNAQSLYHRSPTDGFISIRNKSGGFFITATKTNKIDLDISRISLIHKYEDSSNTLSYSGNYLPSSDSVEAATLYNNFSDLSALIHTHASKQFTRNPKYKDRIAVPPSSYGEVSLGEDLINFIKSQSVVDFIIMEDHGELFLSNLEEPHSIFKEISSLINSEIELNGKHIR